MFTDAKLYVGTYRKYNNGSLFGEWITLSDFSDKDEFLAYCRQLHSDEDDPEFMFQDYEGLPSSLYCESYIDAKVWDVIDALADMERALLNTELGDMIVTPREIDALIQDAAGIIATGINRALQPELSEADIAAMMD